jgi:hypothetical protein
LGNWKKSPTLAYVLTAAGILGIIISLVTEQSDYVDPVAFGFATLSILIAIVGIALAFRMPKDKEASGPTGT